MKPKIIVILGPTSSGKTRLAVKLAMKFNGEIVSADSRQVYRGMDVGTGKDLQEYNVKIPNSKFSPYGRSPEGRQIPNKFSARGGSAFGGKISNSKSKTIITPHHLIDIVNPKRRFNLAEYQKMAFKAIDDILSRGKLPILVGGSGLYLQAVVDNYRLSAAKPDSDFREKLEKMNVIELFSSLKKQSPNFARRLNQSDKNNQRRLIRYLEIVGQGSVNMKKNDKRYRTLLIGLSLPPKELKDRIKKRLINRLEKQDLVGEVKRLHNQGLSWKQLESFGLEYKFVSQYLQKKLIYEEMVEKLNRAIGQFAKRQMSWFRRWERQGANINWEKNDKKIKVLIEKFLK